MVTHSASRFDDKGGIPPEKAVVVLAKYSWGCLTDQKIVRDITPAEMATDATIAEVLGAEDYEDLVVRQELYLHFPAKEINSLPGFFIVRLHAGNTHSPEKGRLAVVKARLLKKDGVMMELLVRPNNAHINTDLYYSRHMKSQVVSVSCPGFEPSKAHQVNLVRAYPFKVRPKTAIQQVNKEEVRITITISPYHLDEAIQIDRCESLLDQLDKAFSVSGESAFLWDMTRMTPAAIRRSVGAITTSTMCQYDVSILTLGRKRPEILWSNNKNLVPKIRQPITLRENNGLLTIGEILIGIKSI